MEEVSGAGPDGLTILTSVLLPVKKAMRSVLLALAVAALSAADSVDILMPGLSIHTNWDEAGEPNPYNYGLGLSFTRTRPDEGDCGQFQAGGMVYKDSFNKWATIGFAGLGLRTPTAVSAEAFGGLSIWNGSGSHGLTPIWYAGVGYQAKRVSVFVDATANTQVKAFWLKFSIPLSK